MKLQTWTISLVFLHSALFFGCDPEEINLPPMKHASKLVSDVEREVPDISKADLDQLVSDHNSFALWMYHKGVEKSGQGENFIYSPFSISTAFSMLWPGAVGDTSDEIAQMLHFRMNSDTFHRTSNKLDRELASRNNYEPLEDEGDAPILDIVNDIWGLDKYPYVQDYLDLLALHYGAGLWIVDFLNNPEAARLEINAYIAEKTRNLIEELLPEDSITDLTRLVLTNAIYFKGAWKYPFNESTTIDQPFTSIDENVTEIPIMNGSLDSASYAEIEGLKAVEMTYVGNDLSMLLILPEDSFTDFEASFDSNKADEIIGALTPMSGMIALPKFKFDSELNLVEIFEDEGYSITFTPCKADFSGLSHTAIEEELYVSDAFHQAAIAVDEEGTEAAAATAIVVDSRGSAPDDMFNIRYDRPFMFIIRDKPTGSFLFMGRVVDAENLD